MYITILIVIRTVKSFAVLCLEGSRLIGRDSSPSQSHRIIIMDSYENSMRLV
jgi:hypothetical protein